MYPDRAMRLRHQKGHNRLNLYVLAIVTIAIIAWLLFPIHTQAPQCMDQGQPISCSLLQESN